MHINSSPAILYFGTPVALISTKSPNGKDNLAPFSSIFWLGWRCMIGLGAASQTAQPIEHWNSSAITYGNKKRENSPCHSDAEESDSAAQRSLVPRDDHSISLISKEDIFHKKIFELTSKEDECY